MSDLLGEDPAAEFLQQEGDELRELGIEDQFAAPAAVEPELVPEAAPDAEADALFAAPASEAEPESFFAAPATDSALLVDEFEADVKLPPQDEPLVNGFVDVSIPDVAPVQQPIPVTVPPEEPESLTKWRQDKVVALQQQEKEEQESSTAWKEKAAKELDDWYNRYNEQLEKVKNENRAAQEQFIEEMTDTKPGNEWEKVARFCDFNPKFSKNTKDVSRMRGLLIQLKQNPLVR